MKFLEIHKKIEPNDITEAFSLRVKTLLYLAPTGTVALIFGALAIQKSLGPIADFLGLISNIIFFYFLFGAIRYVGFLFRFDGIVGKYVQSRLQPKSAVTIPISSDIKGGIFEQFIPIERVSKKSIASGSIDGHEVNYLEYLVTYYPEREKGQVSKSYQVFEIGLKKQTPHVYIDSAHNDSNFFVDNTMDYLRSAISKNRKIELEGEFHKHFDVYYNGDAGSLPLATLTPDNMQQLLEYSKQFDIEILGNRMRLISRKFQASANDLISDIENSIALAELMSDSSGLTNVEEHNLKVRRIPVAII